MVLSNVLSFLAVFVTFTLLYIVVPYIVMGLKFNLDDLLYNSFVALMFGTFSVTVIGYTLVFIDHLVNINRDTMNKLPVFERRWMLVSLILLVVVLLVTVYRKRTKRHLSTAAEFVYHSIKGINKRKVYIRDLKRRTGNRFIDLLRQIAARPFLIIALVGGLCVAVYIRFYFPLNTMFFPYSDVYTHANWAKRLLGNELFPDGIYPYGMHILAAVQSELFGIDMVTIMRYFGCACAIYVMVGVYMIARRMFKSQAAVIISFLIYTLTTIVPAGAHTRMSATLPQEVGMVYLLPCALFMLEFIKTRKFMPLSCLAIAFSMTLMCHFYITIVAIVLLACLFFTYFFDIIKGKLFIKLVGFAVSAVVIAVAPLGIGFAMGFNWHGSMGWAISVILGQKWEDPNVVKSDDPSSPDVEVPAEQEDEDYSGLPLKERIMKTAKKIESGFYALKFIVTSLILIAAMSIFAIILLIIRKQTEYAKYILAMAVYSFLIIFMASCDDLGFPVIIDKVRCVSFYSCCIGFVFAFVVELLLFPLAHFPKLKFTNYITGAAAIAVVLLHVRNNGLQEIGWTFQYQYDGAISTYYRIVNQFEPYKWTIVSSVDETYMTRNVGWHYELSDFIYQLAFFTRESNADTAEPDEFIIPEVEDIRIPSDNVFFFIEKRPIKPYRGYSAKLLEHEAEPLISEEDAKKDIIDVRKSLGLLSDVYTRYDNRRVLMAKAYFWMEEYMKYFPETTVFYEDRDLIVYRVRQEDPFALNNYAIDYGYN